MGKIKINFQLLAACYMCASTLLAQKQPLEATLKPVEVVSIVADRVINNTSFSYKLKNIAPTATFNFVRVVDFGRTIPQAHIGDIAYAHSQLGVMHDTTIVVQFSFAGSIKIFINREEIFRAEKPSQKLVVGQSERAVILSDSVVLKLKKGTNDILIKSQKSAPTWQVYIQPKYATTEFSPVKNLTLGLQLHTDIDASIAAQTDFLISGPYGSLAPSIDIINSPEKSAFNILQSYGSPTGWCLARQPLVPELKNVNPLWGSYDTYNYHAAGLAWAIANLGVYTNKKKYIDFESQYCDFILKSVKQTAYVVDSVGQFQAPQHHLIKTHLLDFTTAPTLPFAQRLLLEQKFGNRFIYQQRVDSIANYALHQQVRLADGTFTRLTPEKYTTWVDDMFMGIPFLVYASQATSNITIANQLRYEAIKQIINFNKNVYDKSANLYYHAQASSKPTAIPHWARANGWGIFATSIVLEQLAKSDQAYNQILKIYTSHLNALVALQNRKTGFWHQILDDTSSYQETSATAIFTMALARGLRLGWIKGSKYEQAAKNGWQAILSQTETNGVVHNICIGTMSSKDPAYYKSRPLADNDSHGLLGVLWAGIEMNKWLYPAKTAKD